MWGENLFSFVTGTVTPNQVSEPGTHALLSSGVSVLCCSGQPRRNRSWEHEWRALS